MGTIAFSLTSISTSFRYLNVAKHVRHLYIRPAFLPGLDEDVLPEQETIHSEKRSRKKFGSNERNPTSNNLGFHEEASLVLNLAIEGLKQCTNLQELTIVLHDHVATPLLLEFLEDLWTGNSIGSNFRRLSVDTTITKIPLIFSLLSKHPKVLPNFEEVVLEISISRFQHSSADWLAAAESLGSFLKTYQATVTSLSISSMTDTDQLGHIFDALPFFQNLKKLEFLAVMNARTFFNRESLTTFVALHASTLENIILKPYPRSATLHQSDSSYTDWLIKEVPETENRWLSFTQLVFPKVHTLQIGLVKMHVGLHNHLSILPNGGIAYPPLLPSLSRIAPHLTRLSVIEASLNLIQVSQIIDVLAVHNGQRILEELSYSCSTLCLHHFDMLSKMLPRLKSLTILYHVAVGENNTGDFTYRGHPGFGLAMGIRCYPTWPVRYLRLLHTSRCGEGHPYEDDMKIVASCISSNVVLDTKWTCTCSGPVSDS